METLAQQKTDARRGAILLSKRVTDEVALIAQTQFETAFRSNDDLIADFPVLEEAVAAAFELAGWARASASSGSARILVAGVGSDESPPDALDRARNLIDEAREGRPCMDAATARAAPIDWLATDEPTQREGGPVPLRWAGPGESRARAPNPAPTPSRQMIGRRSELVELAGSWSGACDGGRKLTLISGEPGSGKTRLASEAAREIGFAGGRVLYGVAEELDAPAYSPFVAAFGDAIRSEQGPSPSFGELLGSPRAASEHPTGAAFSAERSVAFNAALNELEYRCRVSPVALVIEDLHNCGLSSLQLLRHLAGSPDLARLLIVATYRPTELDPSSPEAALIAKLGSDTGVTQIALQPLRTRSLRGLAASFGVDRSSLESVAERVAEETAGLPIYACELIRSIAEGRSEPGAALARSLQALIANRVTSAGADVDLHLSVAAVAGMSFRPDVVASAGNLSTGRLAKSLDRAERAGLVSSDASHSEYTFGHALTRRWLYEGLSTTRRRELHRRIAIAMEKASETDVSVEPGAIAQHWERAGPGNEMRAADWAVRAAQRALGRFDPGAAFRWYDRALELDQFGGPTDAERRCDLLLGLGPALRLDGNARFREVLLEAARLAVKLDDPERLGAATITNTRGFVSAIGEFDRERLAMLELAAEQVEPGPLQALVLAELALELTFSPERERRHELSERALRLAREADDRVLLARVLIRYLIARWEPGNARLRIRVADEAIAAASRLDDPLDRFHGLHWRAAAQIEACELADSHRSVAEQTRIAARLGDPTAEWLTACSQSLRHALQGRLDQAEEAATRAAALGRDSDQPDALPFYASQIASIRWQQGRLSELAPLLDAALENHPGLPAFRSLVALARLEVGNVDGAREAIAVDSSERFKSLPRDPTWFAGAATYAHVAAELEDRSAAEALLELLAPLLGRLATTSVSVWGLTDHAVGRLASTLGDPDTAIKHLDRSLGEYTRLAMPVWGGHAALDLANVLRRYGRDEHREHDLISRAQAVAHRHGAGLLARPPQEPAERQADGRPEIAERLAVLDLTDRQRQVAALIALGMSNDEIAEELVISPHTVKRHAENTFSRIGVRGRMGLMALLHDKR